MPLISAIRQKTMVVDPVSALEAMRPLATRDFDRGPDSATKMRSLITKIPLNKSQAAIYHAISTPLPAETM